MQEAASKRQGARTAALLSILLCGILFPATAGAAPSAVEQYVPKVDRGGVADSQGSGAIPEPPPGASEEAKARTDVPITDVGAGQATGGNVPSTDFPLTPLVALAAACVFAALLIRFVPPLNRAFGSVRPR